MFETFAERDDIAVVTSEDAFLRGPAQLRAFLDDYASGSTRYSWRWDRREVAFAGPVACLLAVGTETAATAGHEHRTPYRMTLVAERAAGRWLLVQVHGSSPHGA